MIVPMNNTALPIPPGTVAFSYVRFSRTIQKQGRSRLRQQEAYEKWCAKHGVIPANEKFLDEGKSGYTGDHVGPKGQLRRFLDLVEAEKIPRGSFLVVESLDRLGRENINFALERFLGILNAGVNVVTLLDNEKVYFSGGTAADLIMSILVMERANEESATKAKRSKDNWQAAFELARGVDKRPVGKQVAFWLEVVELDELDARGKKKKEFRERSEHVATIKRIFDDCIAGHGFVVTAKRLNADNAAAHRAASWGPSSVRDVLENKCVLGEWEPKDGGGVIEGYFPQIITPATWELAHAAMVKRKKGDYTRQTPNFQIWTQVAACSICGSSMNLVTKGPHKYLACSSKRRGLCMDAINVRADKSEEVYKELLVKVGALGLIQTEAAAITDAMALADAALHKEQTLRAQHMKKLAENPGMEFLYELVSTADQNIKRLKAEREQLEAKHAEQTASQSDKAWLLANLPLVDRDDRQRANALLCRLGVTVAIAGGDEPLFTVYQKDRIILKLRVVKGEVRLAPYSPDVAMRMLDQGELETHQLEINVGFKPRLRKPTETEALESTGPGWSQHDNRLPDDAYALLDENDQPYFQRDDEPESAELLMLQDPGE
jgi:DNA invertase Pin-like site-specific DNA recombinase